MKIIKNSHFTLKETISQGKDFHNYGKQFCDVIENADGVPYQLMFGAEPGEGYYIYIGDGIRDLLSVDPGSFTERMYLNMVEQVIPLGKEIAPDFYESRSKLLTGELPRYRVEVLVSTGSGEKKWIRDSSVPIRDENSGSIIGSFGILFDITDRKRANEKADESDRLKTAFLNNISHEVRTPLNAIVGFSTLLCEPEKENYSKKEFIEIISNSTDHFLETMDNILEISRLEAGTVNVVIRELDCCELLKRMQNRFNRAAEEKGLQLVCRLPQDPLTAITDAYKVSQVMINLIANAVKFTSTGIVEFGVRLDESHIEFYVSDTGIGISEQQKKYVFTKFFQAESGITRRFQGTGLGLAISRRYAEMLGGTINFISDEGKGSIFRFSLPLTKNSF